MRAERLSRPLDLEGAMLRFARSRILAGRPLLRAAALLVAAATAAPVGALALGAGLGRGARAAFTSEGLRVSERGENEGGWQWEMPLRAFGRGARARQLGSALRSDGARVEYRRGPLTEWYTNVGPAIEQGFTLDEKPAGSGPLALHFELRTDLAPALSADARSVSFTSAGGARLRYAELSALDARGSELPARFVLEPGRLLLEVDDRDAVYPLTIDPLIYMEAKQVAFDAAADDGYGASLAVDVDTAVVGAPGDDDPIAGDATGAAYVYVRVGAAWVLQQKLTALDMAADDRFGASVAISGETIVVGAPGDDDTVAGADAGSAYVFRRTNGTWSQLGKLLAPDLAASDALGSSVAAFGDTALVGARAGDGLVADSGSAYVFTFDPVAATAPAFQAELNASDGAANDFFGAAVSIDGETAVVGAYGDDDGGGQSGSAYVFVRNVTVWTEQQKLVASDDVAGDEFGRSVGVSADTVVVGAPNDDDQNTDAGSAYLFVRSDTSWSELEEVFAQSPSNTDHFGSSVGISSDAVLVGAPDDGGNQGEVFVFARLGVEWPRVMRIRASDGDGGDRFGAAVAISGGSLAVGAPLDDDLISDQGSAYLFYAYQEDCDLQLATAVNDPEPVEGGTVVFTVTVTNWGPDDASVVAVYSPFPEGLTFVDSLASRGTYDVDTGIWEIGELPNYSSASLTLTGQIPIGSNGETVTHSALLRAFDATPDNNSATVTAHVGEQGSGGVFQNGSFEIDTTPADGQPDGWVLKVNTATDMLDCTTASDGMCSYKIVGTGKARKLYQKFSTTNPAGSYVLGISGKADAVTGTPKVKLSVTFGNGVKKGYTLELPEGTYDWTPYSLPFSTTKAWKSAKLTISWKGQGTLHVDSVVIANGP
jgi:uncharacterized repeat protein (TIGR01451 family)